MMEERPQEAELKEDNAQLETLQQADEPQSHLQAEFQPESLPQQEQANSGDVQNLTAQPLQDDAGLSSSSEITAESVIEAILFATDEPLSAERLVNISQLNGGVRQVKKCIAALNQHYIETKRAFRIEEIAGGYQMMTLPEYNNWLKNLLKQRADNKLSPAALETLAIIAYKQPIIRADIEAIRGVACGEIIRTLMYKGLIKITGKAEILGRPLLYGTTKKFLQVFGLNDLKDLPKAEELKQPVQQ